MEEKDLDVAISKAIREAMKAKTADGQKAKHYCWKKRLVFMGVVAVGLAGLSHLIHVEELSRGWEFVAACTVDKLIFGIAEA